MPNARIVYEPDEYGDLQAVVYGEDAYGNPVMVDQSAPWYRDVLMTGLNTVGGIFGGGRRYDGYYAPQVSGGAAVNTQVSPGGISTNFGLSNTTLLLIGVVAAFFLLGKRGR